MVNLGKIFGSFLWKCKNYFLKIWHVVKSLIQKLKRCEKVASKLDALHMMQNLTRWNFSMQNLTNFKKFYWKIYFFFREIPFRIVRFNKVLFFLAYGKNESKRATFNAMFFSICNYSIILRVQILTKWKNFHWNLNAFQISSFKTLFLVFFSSFAWDINSVAGIKYKLLNRTDLQNLVFWYWPLQV